MMTPFFQEGPRVSSGEHSKENAYLADRVLRSLLKRKLTPLDEEMLHAVEADLTRFGVRVSGDVLAMSRRAEAELPKLVQYDPWGRRVDQLVVSSAWSELDSVAAEEGIVAEGYERRYGALSRLVQFAKLYLFHPSSAFYSCPLAMTDGAARAIEVHGDAELKAGAFKHLTSRNPSEFWTSGQWMTEREGGSDVANSSTVARLEGGAYRLYGEKWFTSATTSQMAMTLARIEGAPAGSKGLSLFYLELRDHEGRLQNIRVNRLKEKLGTKALPTAELSLEGTPAKLMGGEGGGVKRIATLFNITRLYNSCCAVASMRRCLVLLRDYSTKRSAFGKPLSEHPLHLETLAQMQIEFEAAMHLTFFAAELLGKEELGQATPQESATLRGLMPIVKLYTGKQSIALASEVIEGFGGAGYVEDTDLPRLLRDAQVFSIWEGTTNVLSLDLLRAIEKEGAFEGIVETIQSLAAGITNLDLQPSVDKVNHALQELAQAVPLAVEQGGESLQATARKLAFCLARTLASALLLDHAQWGHRQGDLASAVVARRWCSQDLTAGLSQREIFGASYRQESRILALDL